MRRFIRALGTFMVLAGIGTLLWAFAVWRWEDPFTSLYTAWKQRGLESAFAERLRAYPPDRQPDDQPLVVDRRQLRLDAKRYRGTLERGDAIGRLRVPRIGLNVIVVNGTDANTLKKGPGRYLGSFVPGEGKLVYVAGHRTTYGAPFSHIDALRRGDRVMLEMPYATFVYVVTGHRIVAATELSVLKSRGRETLALQACHPRFFATERYIAYARPLRIVPRGVSADVAIRLAARAG